VLQSLSGTGSLRVGAEFIHKWLPGKTMYISSPTWGNHRNIFSDAGLEWKYYRYFDPETVGLDFEGMKADLEAAPEGSIIVLHGTRLACVKTPFPTGSSLPCATAALCALVTQHYDNNRFFRSIAQLQSR
jgi:aspartate/tyrosine/aromatic aminotransferase